MPNARARFVLVGFLVGVGCGIALGSGMVAPGPVEAQDRIAAAPLSGTSAELAQRVTALEARLQRIEGSIVVSSNGAVTIKGPRLEITASGFHVQTSPAVFANMITGKTLTVSSVISASYTPGTGNIW